MSLRTEVNNYFAQAKTESVTTLVTILTNLFIAYILPSMPLSLHFSCDLLLSCTRDSTLQDILSLNYSAILRVTVFLVTQKKHLVVKIGCQWQRQG